MSRHLRRGFSLVEILVVIGIILVIAGIAYPIMGRAKDSAYRTVCVEQLKQTYVALQLYGQDYETTFQPEGLKVLMPYLGSSQILRCPKDIRDRKLSDGLYAPNGIVLWHATTNRSPFQISYATVAEVWGDIGYETQLQNWERMQAIGRIGIIACPFHAAPKSGSMPNGSEYDGAQVRDGPALRILGGGSLYVHHMDGSKNRLYWELFVAPHSVPELLGLRDP